jgi:gamma-glutamylcyclotransferase (GGCT)/AIG2-like uncharacterized protein YtfP
MRAASGVKPKREDIPEFLFVYGTLMRGGRLHGLLGDSPNVKFVGEAKIRAELYRPRGEDYPAAVSTSSADRFVFGELYALLAADLLLKRLDQVEACDEGLYVRRRVNTIQDRKKQKAWVYLYAQSVADAEPIPDGRFQIVRATD